MIVEPEVASHVTGGGLLDGAAPVLVWRFDAPVRAVSSAVLGGGVGDRCWITNATVGFQYDEPDPADHAARIAAELGLDPATGVGLLTAVDVGGFTVGADGGAEVVATTGLGAVTWAAAPDGEYHEWRPGTVNVVAWVPEPVADAALVNLVATVAEAKAQAFGEAGVPATGTPTDAVVVCCPVGEVPDDDDHRYGGPRSRWGARVARAVHSALTEGIERDRARPRSGAAPPDPTDVRLPGGRSAVRSLRAAPVPGSHGGDGRRLAAALGLPVGDVLDLSATLNPVAPDMTQLAARHLGELARYPDDAPATAALAAAIGVDPDRVVLTNGGSEAIALVAGVLGAGWVEEPEFSLYRRHLRVLDPSAGRWRSNPRNPTGELAGPGDEAAVWDEAFHPLATGTWTRGEGVGLGSLTKLFACPGLRVGYVLDHGDGALAAEVRRRRPEWSVNGLACALLPELLATADLSGWSAEVASLRSNLVGILDTAGLEVVEADAPWVLVHEAGDLRDRLATHGILVRDCASFGMPGTVRIGVPDDAGRDRLARALSDARQGRRPPD